MQEKRKMLLIFIVIGILISIIILCISNNLKLRNQIEKNSKMLKLLNERNPNILNQMYVEQGQIDIQNEQYLRDKIGGAAEMRSPVMNILGILRKQFVPPTIIEEKNEDIQEEEEQKREEEEEIEEKINTSPKHEKQV